MPVLGESRNHLTAEIKSIHEAVRMASDVVMRLRISASIFKTPQKMGRYFLS